MPADGDPTRPAGDLATMLAEMDSRLQVLQQELESVALPIARRAPEQRRPTRRGGEAAAAAAEEEPASPPASDERPRRLVTRAAPSASPAEAPDAAFDLPGSPRRPPKRRITGTPRTLNSAPSPRSAPPARTAPEPPPANMPEAVVRQTIVEAESEARRVVEDARVRIAEIGARTRALLEHSLAEPARPAKPPAPSPVRRHRARTARTARRDFEGTISIEAGPFGDVVALSAFEDALASIPAVEDVYIRTFERNRAHFELHVAEPTALIVELQARAEDSLNVIATGENEIRLEIVKEDEQ